MIIFLDEPTSGLDSFQAKNIIQILKDLAEQGHIVICSIHQPSSCVFNLFDKVIFLSNGKCVYSGYRNDCTEYFGDLDFKCPEFYNPADYILDLISFAICICSLRIRTASLVSRVGLPLPFAAVYVANASFS